MFKGFLVMGCFNTLMHTAVWWLQQDSLVHQCLAAVGVIGLSGAEGHPHFTLVHVFFRMGLDL